MNPRLTSRRAPRLGAVALAVLGLGFGPQPIAFATASTGGQQEERSSTPAKGETYTFREPLVNGRGLRSLEDLRGRVVLIEFWGTR